MNWIIQQIIRLANQGVSKDNTPDYNKTIKITNQISLFTIVLSTLMVFLLIMLGVPKAFYFTAFIPPIMAIPLWFNYKKRYFISRLYYLCMSYIIILCLAIIFGEKLHFQYYLIGGIGMPIIILSNDKGRLKWMLVFIAIPLWIFLEWHYKMVEPLVIISGKSAYFLRFINDLLVFITVMYSILIFARQNNKQLTEIENKNVLLSKINNAQSESIQYAKKIQRSILPSSKVLNILTNTNFIFFRPRDIIGGDFYWYFKLKDYHYLAVIDCTGHGVPGALMSMTINALLNEIMFNGDVLEPGKIITSLHAKLYDTLHQREGDKYAQDGCDMSLCRFDLTKKEIAFAGAQNDLYLYKNDSLRIVEATKKSVGGIITSQKKEPFRAFVTHTFQIKPNTLILLTTDGIIEQQNFENKSFGNKEFPRLFEQLYLENDSLKMSQSFEHSINKWMKGCSQLDDMLVIGLSF